MSKLTTRERFVRVLTGQDSDKIPFMKVFGGTNAIADYWEDSNPGLSKDIDKILGFEGIHRGWAVTPVNMRLCNLPAEQTLEETEDYKLVKYGDGTIRKYTNYGSHGFSGHTIEHPVKTWADWEFIKENYLFVDIKDRFPNNWNAYVDEFNARDYPLQLTHRGVYGFARTMMGDVNLAYAFFDQPNLVHDIMDSYTKMSIETYKQMSGVKYDLIECWEDMAFNQGSMISRELFNEFMVPNYKKLTDFMGESDIPILLVDSDGYIEDLAEWMYDSGVNAMYPFEVQAGNSIERVRNILPGMGCIGGLDKNCMAHGKAEMDEQLHRAEQLIKLGRFIPGPDHFVLSDVSYENYKYFMENLKRILE